MASTALQTVPKPHAASSATSPHGFLTRRQAANRLQVSISTVRRMEGAELSPRQIDGVHYFEADAVDALAAAQPAVTPRPPSRKRAAYMEAGELAAEVFALFAQRMGIHEIVMTLHVPPAQVRALYHEWRTCLERGEMEAADTGTNHTPMYPENSRQRPATVNQATCTQLLAALPHGEPTRISVAACEGNDYIDGRGYTVFAERLGFVAHGPVELGDLSARYGAGLFRITAMPEGQGDAVLWEVFVDLSTQQP